MNSKEILYSYCLRLGDDALILGQRLSELCSKGPILEEDLAQTNIALDMIGRAQALFNYASEINGGKNTADDIAYRRPEFEYRNHLLVEQPNEDFAHIIARQLYISAFEVLLYGSLENSKDTILASIASKTIKEIKYHLQHASDWTVRLGDGTPESTFKMQRAINNLWMYTGELFEMDSIDEQLLKSGIGVDKAPLIEKWHKQIQDTLSEATLTIPEETFMQSGGNQGVHTEHMGHLLSEMQYLQRTYPDAKW